MALFRCGAAVSSLFDEALPMGTYKISDGSGGTSGTVGTSAISLSNKCFVAHVSGDDFASFSTSVAYTYKATFDLTTGAFSSGTTLVAGHEYLIVMATETGNITFTARS